MNQALGFFGWRRADIALRTLDAITKCRGIERWPIIAFLDEGYDNRIKVALKNLGAEIDCARKKEGCSGNLTRGIHKLFDTCSSRFLVFEDDIFPAPDAIEFLERALDKHAGDNVFSAGAYHHGMGVPDPTGLLEETEVVAGFHCWGWGTWVKNRDHFLSQLYPVTGDHHADSWDTKLNKYSGMVFEESGQLGCCLPTVSRVVNIGTREWTHTPGETLPCWSGEGDPNQHRV